MQTPRIKNVSNQPEVRSLKIHPDYQSTSFGTAIVPHIRLKGQWLHELGFAPNGRVKITAMNKKLIIQLDE